MQPTPQKTNANGSPSQLEFLATLHKIRKFDSKYEQRQNQILNDFILVNGTT